MMKNVLVAVVVLVLLGTNRAPITAQTPSDACALLPAAEAQALAGTAKVSAGKSSTDQFGSNLCQYEWGTGANAQAGRSFLTVTLTTTAQTFPGFTPALAQQGLLAPAKAGKPNTAVIPGVGDAAIYESIDSNNVKTTAMAKGNMVVIVAFESLDARAKKDQVIALLKAAAGRL